MLPIADALVQVLRACETMPLTTVPLREAEGYYLAEDIETDRDYPPFHRVMMDGYAIQSGSISSGTAELSVAGTVLAGEAANFTVDAQSCVKIMTGCPLPEGADAVIRVEDSTSAGEGKVALTGEGIKPWHNVANRGQESAAVYVILKAGTRIGHAEATVLATVGKAVVPVYQKPRVALLTTGSEVVDASVPAPESYQIRDSNSYALGAALAALDIKPVSVELADDNLDNLRAAIEAGLESDVLCLTGGVSMGDADFVPQLLKEAGVECIFHKVAIKPGKPLWFGKSKTGGLVFGLPGNPFSAVVDFKIFTEAALKAKQGADPALKTLPVSAGFERKRRGNRTEYIPVRLGSATGGLVAEYPGHKGSGDMRAAVGSDGLAVIDRSEVQTGDKLSFIPWRSFL